jgi:hypothetical protein
MPVAVPTALSLARSAEEGLLEPHSRTLSGAEFKRGGVIHDGDGRFVLQDRAFGVLA